MAKQSKVKLDYSLKDLEPWVSEHTMECHYDFHYGGYLKNFNSLIKGTMYRNMTPLEVVTRLNLEDQDLIDNPIYNNAAQVINHERFFTQFSAKPQKTLKNERFREMLKDKIGTLSDLKKQLKERVIKHFGSGWVWLTLEQNLQWDAPHLSIATTPNAGTFTNNSSDQHFVIPLLVIDVWEHAYYLDSQYDRSDYVSSFWEILDWRIIEERFEREIDFLVDYTKPFEL